MKRGAKRPALSDSDPNPGDFTALRSKRVMEAPSFVHRAESSRQQQLMVGSPSLDVKRAESARQHVRALNTQFASWVQIQLQNHPDELWEDGVKDYLSHASQLLEKFKDVVDWLRSETAKSEAATTTALSNDHNKSLAALGTSEASLKSDSSSANEIKSSGFQSFGLSNSHGSGLFSISRTSSSSSSVMNSALPSSQNSGLISFSQKPASSKLQSSGPSTSKNTGFFGIGQKPVSSSLQSSESSSSQSSGFFAFGQTQTTSSLQNSCVSGSQSSGLFSFSQTPLSSSSQIFGLSGISQKPANSSLQSSGSSGLQSSGLFSINQTPVFGGTQTFSAPTVQASGDADEENEPEQPSSPSLKKIEEKGVVVVHEVKCRVYMKAENPTDKIWKEIGRGPLSIKCKEGADKASKESRPTIVVRNDVGKIVLNALIYPGIKMNINKNTIATIFHTSGGEQNGVEDGKGSVVARTYLLKPKTEEETKKLAAAIQDYAPLA